MSGFKKFLLRGNVVDLAVAVVIGAAFGAVVNALVKDLITPIISAFGGLPNFSGWFRLFARRPVSCLGCALHRLQPFGQFQQRRGLDRSQSSPGRLRQRDRRRAHIADVYITTKYAPQKEAAFSGMLRIARLNLLAFARFRKGLKILTNRDVPGRMFE